MTAVFFGLSRPCENHKITAPRNHRGHSDALTRFLTCGKRGTMEYVIARGESAQPADIGKVVFRHPSQIVQKWRSVMPNDLWVHAGALGQRAAIKSDNRLHPTRPLTIKSATPTLCRSNKCSMVSNLGNQPYLNLHK